MFPRLRNLCDEIRGDEVLDFKALLAHSAVVAMASEECEEICDTNSIQAIFERIRQTAREGEQDSLAEAFITFRRSVADRCRAKVMITVEAQIPFEGMLPTFKFPAW
jgi:hypothetical protein